MYQKSIHCYVNSFLRATLAFLLIFIAKMDTIPFVEVSVTNIYGRTTIGRADPTPPASASSFVSLATTFQTHMGFFFLALEHIEFVLTLDLLHQLFIYQNHHFSGHHTAGSPSFISSCSNIIFSEKPPVVIHSKALLCTSNSALFNHSLLLSCYPIRKHLVYQSLRSWLQDALQITTSVSAGTLSGQL